MQILPLQTCSKVKGNNHDLPEINATKRRRVLATYLTNFAKLLYSWGRESTRALKVRALRSRRHVAGRARAWQTVALPAIGRGLWQFPKAIYKKPEKNVSVSGMEWEWLHPQHLVKSRPSVSGPAIK